MDMKTFLSENYASRALPTKLRGNEQGGISGEATVFNQYSNDLGGFVEIIERDAFEGTQMDDVVALFNHNQNFVLGRTGANTLSLEVTNTGLEYRIAPQVTQMGRDIEASVKRGDINTSSFGFDLLPDGSEWTYDSEGRVLHRIKKIARLWDVSPVTWAAYSQTNARSLEKAKELLEKAKKERDESQQKLDATQEAAEVIRGMHKRARERALQLRFLEAQFEL